MPIVNDILKFLASLWCAIFLIVAVAVVIAAGTIIESSYGTEAAQILVYQTPWFAIILLLLATNLSASALSRWPWKKKHVGFLTTHLGIILILMGSLATQRFGIEGQVAITEGDSESRITLFQPLLEMISTNTNEHWAGEPKLHALPWTGRQPIHLKSPGPVSAVMLQDFPKAKAEESAQESADGLPALHFSLVGSMAGANEWLILDSPTRQEMTMGAATIRFSREPIRTEKKRDSEARATGAIRFHFDSGKTLEVPIDENSAGKRIELSGTPYQIKITRLLRDAIVEQNQLMDRSEEWRNPALELNLTGQGIEEHHTVFANFPDFPTVHGRKPSAASVRIEFRMMSTASISPKNELRFINRENELPRYQIKKGDEIREGIVKLGETVETGWMDFKFTVDQFYPRAKLGKIYTPLPSGSQRNDAVRVMQAEFSDGTNREVRWLEQGEVATFGLGKREMHAVYGLKTMPLGFALLLKDFKMDTDPGTERPASFKSDVTLKDVAKGINRDLTIQMNEPLSHRGFTIYQSAYQVRPGQPDVSIFSVARDPGIAVKYAGAVIMVGGILLLFYAKPYSTLKTGDPKMRTMQ